jgi:hypothetical protein
MADRFAWGDADLVPESKADRDRLASRTMDKFLRSGAHRSTARRDSGGKQG